MPPALLPTARDDAPLPTLAPDEVAAARAYVDASRAAFTRRDYEADWRRFAT